MIKTFSVCKMDELENHFRSYHTRALMFGRYFDEPAVGRVNHPFDLRAVIRRAGRLERQHGWPTLVPAAQLAQVDAFLTRNEFYPVGQFNLGDHTPRDVSMMTGMRQSTVRVHLFRAVHKLRAALEAWRDLR